MENSVLAEYVEQNNHNVVFGRVRILNKEQIIEHMIN